MSLSGAFELFRVRPRHPVGADGRMALGDHLRELRARLMRSGLAVVVGFLVAIFFYSELFELVMRPYNDARVALGEDVETAPYIAGATGPLMLQLKLCGVAALVFAAPVWLHQIWAFIVPALHRHEKRWSVLFAMLAGPLFLGGVALAFYVLPKGLEVLIGFTPANVQSLVEFGDYFSFFTRMLLVFGIALEIPLFVVMLNLAGIVSGKAIGRARPWIVIGSFVFSAVATPSTDPFAMTALALTMTLLFVVSEVVARLVDRFRARRPKGTDQWSDDEVSPL